MQPTYMYCIHVHTNYNQHIHVNISYQPSRVQLELCDEFGDITAHRHLLKINIFVNNLVNFKI